MRNLFFLAVAGLAVALSGCTGQSVKETSPAQVEQRDILEQQRKAEEEAKRKAQIEREEAELARQRAMKDGDGVEVKPMPGAGVDGTMGPKSMREIAAMLKDPNNPLSKRSIYYDYDRYDVKQDYQSVVEAHAALLMANKDLKVRVESHCDERGSTEYNLALGQKRADNVRRALALLGVPANRIESVSFGEEKPKALGKDEDSYAENRRSDLMYPGIDN
jgi:peptidoglycan-associated lipoprotein